MSHIENVICANCGKVFEAKAANIKYCSRLCAYQRAQQQKIKVTFQCDHNEGVICEKRKCGSCGWNPEVAQRRMNKILGKECTA